MAEASLYSCINPACGRHWPRPVNFCPYCGAAQKAGVVRGDVAAHAAPSAGPGVRLDKPVNEELAAEPALHAPPPVPAPAPPARPVPAVAPARPAAAAAPAASARAGVSAGRAAPAPGVRAATTPPPKRQPVRLRWWLLALAILWVIWLVANPGKRRIEAQMEKAASLATACKPREAQNELIALHKTRATPQQLRQVQQALNEAGADCSRKRQRDKAWREAKAAAEASLDAGAVDKARQRLRAFTKRWGDDQAARALKEKIDERQPEHPRADEVR